MTIDAVHSSVEHLRHVIIEEEATNQLTFLAAAGSDVNGTRLWGGGHKLALPLRRPPSHAATPAHA
jgi:hypothetical protein